METKFERRIVSNGVMFRIQIRAMIEDVMPGDWTSLKIDYRTREEADTEMAKQNAEAADVWEPV